MTAPLAGIRIVEFAGIGPAPFCGMVLADLGADVVRIGRPGHKATPFSGTPYAVTERGRRDLALDLKDPEDRTIALSLLKRADAALESFRPGTLERLGLDPAALLEANPRLVLGRLSGWGQTGPLAARAGHDITYLALSGLLDAIGTAERPIPPLNLVADYGGAAMHMAVGIVAGILTARSTGVGRIIDLSISEAAASLGGLQFGLAALGEWRPEREANLLDGGAPFYRCYRCADGKFVAVGAFEPEFYAALLQGLGLSEAPELLDQHDRARWPAMAERIGATFATRTRDEWADRFAGTDACVAPVLTMAEAPHHPQHQARGAFVERDGVIQPASPLRGDDVPASTGEGGAQILRDWGVVTG